MPDSYSRDGRDGRSGSRRFQSRNSDYRGSSLRKGDGRYRRGDGDGASRFRDRRDGERFHDAADSHFEREGSGRARSGGRNQRGGDRLERQQRERQDRRGGRRHAQRAGSGRSQGVRSAPQRKGFREERMNRRLNEPVLPDDVTTEDLDSTVIQDLRSLSKDNADKVGRHMVMAATLMHEDPQLALRHARAAKERAGRVAVVRETCGIAAYHAGEWKEALSELRTARRITGGPGLLAVMADCERGLGRPDRAIELARSEQAELLDPDSKVELAIVVAGARQDMAQVDAAIAELEALGLDSSRHGVTASRLFYAYADALAAAGRTQEAREWFNHAISADEDELLDAQERLRELGG